MRSVYGSDAFRYKFTTSTNEEQTVRKLKINICFEIRESSPYAVDHLFHFTHFIAFGQKKLLSGRLKIVGFYASRSLLISFEQRPTTIQRLLVKSCDLPKSIVHKIGMMRE
ncbi:hypothetical protein T4B_12281 [Trichinella pseudospiralis]|uniref:Uncharacterized protein n=1 Tax=Trichinella pseudospiralis TaxID=6337 RepID=A0A0V1J5K4_TRIPS|nr:hypothetical protein T4B_12281 [Trichinella pseudospiralis]